MINPALTQQAFPRSCIDGFPSGNQLKVRQTGQHEPNFVDHLLAWVAVTLPFCLTMWRAAATAQWRGDLPAIRDQGLVAVGIGNNVSTLVTQAMLLLPVGSRSFRGSCGSAIALALASWLLFRLARRLLWTSELPPRLGSLLAAIAALTATLSATWQAEATVGGGALFAIVLVLAGVDVLMKLTAHDAATLTPAGTSRWLILAALCGAATAESLPAGLVLMLACGLGAATAGKRPAKRLLLPAIGLALATFGILIAPTWLRPLAPRGWSDIGAALSSTNLTALGVAASRRTALSSWLLELGFVSLGLAAFGIIRGVFQDRRRAWMGPLVAFPLADLLYPISATTGLSPDPLICLRALSIGAFAVGAALGVGELVLFLRDLRVPMARTASIMTVVFYMTVAAVTCEEASFVADRSEHFAAQAWTDLALGEVRADAALLVHSPALSWRLWAAQMLRGERPDVMVIAAPLLKRGRVMAHLVPTEPNVTPLLRDFALRGRASEFGLSVLADARPLRVELDRSWSPELLGHLAVDGAWLRFAAEPLGRSDRALRSPHQLASNFAVDIQVGAAKRDASTARVVAQTLKEHAMALCSLGMAKDSMSLVRGVERLTGADPFVVGARLRINHAIRRRRGHRPLALNDLLRF